jgi:hypothetical protein
LLDHVAGRIILVSGLLSGSHWAESLLVSSRLRIAKLRLHGIIAAQLCGVEALFAGIQPLLTRGFWYDDIGAGRVVSHLCHILVAAAGGCGLRIGLHVEVSLN